MRIRFVIFLFSVVASASAQASADVDADTMDVIAMATKTLEAHLHTAHPDVIRFEVMALSHQEALIPSDAKIEDVRIVRIGARSTVRVVSRAEQNAQVHMIWFDVKGLQAVVVAARDISPLTSLSESDGVVAEHDVMTGSCGPVLEVSALNTMRAKRALRAGDLFCAEYLEPRPAVARGEAVTVHYVGEQVELTTKGIARHDAGIGQRLVLLNPATRETFSGVVAAVGEVQVNAH